MGPTGRPTFRTRVSSLEWLEFSSNYQLPLPLPLLVLLLVPSRIRVLFPTRRLMLPPLLLLPWQLPQSPKSKRGLRLPLRPFPQQQQPQRVWGLRRRRLCFSQYRLQRRAHRSCLQSCQACSLPLLP
jgi:hypothetical protein